MVTLGASDLCLVYMSEVVTLELFAVGSCHDGFEARVDSDVGAGRRGARMYPDPEPQ